MKEKLSRFFHRLPRVGGTNQVHDRGLAGRGDRCRLNTGIAPVRGRGTFFLTKWIWKLRHLCGLVFALPVVSVYAAAPSLLDVMSSSSLGDVGSGELTTGLFTPPLTDRSIMLLQQIFGSVANLLQGTGSQLLGEMFAVFNLGVWVIAGSFVVYTTLMSIMNTAKDGQFMGRGQMSGWVAVRTVGGVGMLLPVYTGYSFIQVLVMWIVIQGVGLADRTWAVAIDYLRQGGALYESPLTGGGSGTTTGTNQTQDMLATISRSSQILQSLLCLHALQQQSKQQTGFSAGPLVTSDMYGKRTLKLGNKAHPDACGVYSWSGGGEEYERYKKIGLSVMIGALLPTADFVINKKQTVAPKVCLNCGRKGSFNKARTRCRGSDLEAGKFCRESNSLVTAASDYLSVVRPVRQNYGKEQDAKILNQFKMAIDEGWIMAGKYYYLFTNPELHTGALDRTHYLVRRMQAPEVNEILKTHPTIYQGYKEAIALVGRGGNLDADDFETIFSTSIGSDLSLNIKPNYAEMASAVLYALYNRGEQATGMGGLFSSKHCDDPGDIQQYLRCRIRRLEDRGKPKKKIDVGTAIVRNVRKMISRVVDAWVDINLPDSSKSDFADKVTLYEDPVRRARALGLRMIEAATRFWKDTTKETFEILTTTASISQAFLMGTAMILSGMPEPFPQTIMAALTASTSLIFQVLMSIIFWYFPLGVAMSMPVFMMGFSLGIYTPLIPYIIYTFAGIGWLIAVVEAMAAAPLIALGVTHPEGHDLMGKAEQSLMILLTIFLRPVAILMGLIIGIVLSFVGLNLLNMGFFHVMANQIDAYSAGFGGKGTTKGMNMFIAVGGTMLIYATLLMAIINQSFSLIYLLHSRLARWIGGPADQPMEAGLLQEVKQGAEGSMEKGAQGGAQGAQAMRSSQIAPGAQQGKGKEKGKGEVTGTEQDGGGGN